ncbi:MAG: hypothetical protein ACLFUR_06645 [Candidatus Hadarchaeia archaeon]
MENKRKIEKAVVDLLKKKRFVGFAFILIITAVVIWGFGLLVTFGMIAYSGMVIYVVFEWVLGARLKVEFEDEERKEE